MRFNDHWKLKGKHAFLSASKYHWVRYDIEKLRHSYRMYMNSVKGTELHDFAAKCIMLKQKLPKSKKTINMYVNDAIGFRMNVEQTLYYSDNCFGTADAISFRDNLLRIHDYKSGSFPTKIDQLLVYAAIFCLEYAVDPAKIKIELRIYQNNEIVYHNPTADEVKDVMMIIIDFDKEVNVMKLEEEM